MASLFISDPIVSRCLVIGSGIAGLQFALLAAEQGPVRIVTKKESRESNTNYAQGGIAAAVSPLDDFELHVQDTLIAGDGLCHEDVVRRMVEAGPALIERLLAYGVDFSRDEAGDPSGFALGREGGHSRRRVLHCRDLTGREIESRLLAACSADPRHHRRRGPHGSGTDPRRRGRARRARRPTGWSGAWCWTATRLERRRLPGRRRGAGHRRLRQGLPLHQQSGHRHRATAWPWPTAPAPRLRNLEFVQFHPTCLYHPEAKSFLISEAVRGEGAVLINRRGRAVHVPLPSRRPTWRRGTWWPAASTRR